MGSERPCPDRLPTPLHSAQSAASHLRACSPGPWPLSTISGRTMDSQGQDQGLPSTVSATTGNNFSKTDSTRERCVYSTDICSDAGPRLEHAPSRKAHPGWLASGRIHSSGRAWFCAVLSGLLAQSHLPRPAPSLREVGAALLRGTGISHSLLAVSSTQRIR